MTQITPSSMLAEYRANADPFMQGQAAAFRELSPDARLELLFYMTMHTSMTLMSLQQMLMSPIPNRGKPQ